MLPTPPHQNKMTPFITYSQFTINGYDAWLQYLFHSTIFAWDKIKEWIFHIFVFFFFHNKDTFTAGFPCIFHQLHSMGRIFESFVPGRSKQSYLKIEEDVVFVQSELRGPGVYHINPKVTWNSFCLCFLCFLSFFVGLLVCWISLFVCLFVCLFFCLFVSLFRLFFPWFFRVVI